MSDKFLLGHRVTHSQQTAVATCSLCVNARLDKECHRHVTEQKQGYWYPNCTYPVNKQCNKNAHRKRPRRQYITDMPESEKVIV